MAETITLELCTQAFQGQQIKIELNGFLMTFGSNDYIVTLHHNLPIHEIIISDPQMKPNILFNPMWNESLILDANDIKCHLAKYKTTNIIQNKLPKSNENLSMITNNMRYEMNTLGIDFISFDLSPAGPKIPYIMATLKDNICDLSGFSGSPVFIDDKLVGIFSKFNKAKYIAYILPIYIIIKTIEKKDNSQVYTVMQSNIKKINNYNVKDDMVYHPTLKIYIPLSSYFLIEGDMENKFTLQYMENELITLETCLYPTTDLTLSNNMDIIFVDREYMITTRLLTLMKRIVDINIIKIIWSKVLSNMNKTIWIKIDNRELTIKLK